MSIAFFVSSIGDTDLALATVNRLGELKFPKPIYFISTTEVAANRTLSASTNLIVTTITLSELCGQSSGVRLDQLSDLGRQKINAFIIEKDIKRAYIGVGSNDNQVPYQIGECLTIPYTIAYEHMFKPEKHVLWKYVKNLTSKPGIDVAIPLAAAAEDFTRRNPEAKIHVVGHLCIEKTLLNKDKLLEIEDDLIFISGTTQPIETDANFLAALLQQITTENFSHFQIRFGIHPGTSNLDNYLQAILNICERYPSASNQFKIVINSQCKQKLKQTYSSPFILFSEISGPELAQTAGKIGQAVPGFLLNEAAILGKPSFYQDESSQPYLPKDWFAKSLSAFFKEKRRPARSLEEFGLQDCTSNIMAGLMARN